MPTPPVDNNVGPVLTIGCVHKHSWRRFIHRIYDTLKGMWCFLCRALCLHTKDIAVGCNSTSALICVMEMVLCWPLLYGLMMLRGMWWRVTNTNEARARMREHWPFFHMRDSQAMLWRPADAQNCDLGSMSCSWMSNALSNTHTQLVHTLPPIPPRRVSPLESQCITWVFSEGDQAATTQQRSMGYASDGPSLTASESSNPCRYKLSYMENPNPRCKIDRKSKGSTCSREDGWWGRESDRAHQCSLSPHEARLQSNRSRFKLKKRWSPAFSSMLNWMLLPLSRVSVGSHYEAALLSPEAERTWHFICLQSSDHTSQSLLSALADDRGEMQPTDWLTEAPVNSTEQGRGREEEGGGVCSITAAWSYTICACFACMCLWEQRTEQCRTAEGW